ncbi:hypothetical protein SAMN00777080_4499 [Aquiflexum balticum DSM 16537]|uniref:Uncharacterized protein n=1 Tax=Aquiflexum balticum DSM 16537 TaxID=758820 RepID=A0A1W2HAT9_9BACT|nr:hypothetical protein SAMN00777080_4499 [Aquiflexum balticum DSM 16537]
MNSQFRFYGKVAKVLNCTLAFFAFKEIVRFKEFKSVSINCFWYIIGKQVSIRLMLVRQNP